MISMHALKAMDLRNFLIDEIMKVIENGEIIAEYPYDKPYPSYLILGFIETRPVHAVVAKEGLSNLCIIITCYEPDSELWESGYRIKIK